MCAKRSELEKGERHATIMDKSLDKLCASPALSSTHCASAPQRPDPGSNLTAVNRFLRKPCLRAVKTS